MPRQPILTLPNLLTLSRIPLALLVWVVAERADVLIPIMVVAAITDLLDGRFARMIRARRQRRGLDHGQLGESGGIGAWLDPVCDKLFIMSLLAAIWVTHAPHPLAVAAIATRELFLVPIVLLYKLMPRPRRDFHFDFRAGLVGKLATVAQFAAVAAILVAPDVLVYLAITAAATGIMATIHYLWRAVQAIDRAG